MKCVSCLVDTAAKWHDRCLSRKQLPCVANCCLLQRRTTVWRQWFGHHACSAKRRISGKN